MQHVQETTTLSVRLTVPEISIAYMAYLAETCSCEVGEALSIEAFLVYLLQRHVIELAYKFRCDCMENGVSDIDILKERGYLRPDYEGIEPF